MWRRFRRKYPKIHRLIQLSKFVIIVTGLPIILFFMVYIFEQLPKRSGQVQSFSQILRDLTYNRPWFLFPETVDIPYSKKLNGLHWPNVVADAKKLSEVLDTYFGFKTFSEVEIKESSPCGNPNYSVIKIADDVNYYPASKKINLAWHFPKSVSSAESALLHELDFQFKAVANKYYFSDEKPLPILTSLSPAIRFSQSLRSAELRGVPQDFRNLSPKDIRRRSSRNYRMQYHYMVKNGEGYLDTLMFTASFFINLCEHPTLLQDAELDSEETRHMLWNLRQALDDTFICRDTVRESRNLADGFPKPEDAFELHQRTIKIIDCIPQMSTRVATKYTLEGVKTVIKKQAKFSPEERAAVLFTAWHLVQAITCASNTIRRIDSAVQVGRIVLMTAIVFIIRKLYLYKFPQKFPHEMTETKQKEE